MRVWASNDPITQNQRRSHRSSKEKPAGTRRMVYGTVSVHVIDLLLVLKTKKHTALYFWAAQNKSLSKRRRPERPEGFRDRCWELATDVRSFEPGRDRCPGPPRRDRPPRLARPRALQRLAPPCGREPAPRGLRGVGYVGEPGRWEREFRRRGEGCVDDGPGEVD